MITHREVQRTPGWTKTKGKTIDTALIAETSSLMLTESLEKRTESTLGPDVASPAKDKPKTRGIPILRMPPTVENQEVVPAGTPMGPAFTIPKRSYKVFASMFHPPTEDGVSGDLAWSDFLNAMVSLNCSIRKLDGSAWYFSPPNQSRSIIFHEPHPDNKIPFHWVRRFGRRLERAFGWTSDTFAKEN